MSDNIEYFGKYTLLERVAVGGMAEIYRAKTVGLGGFEKLLAIKRLHPQFGQEEEVAQMLVDEARIAVHLTHPNIAQIFDLGCIDGQYFIAMEFIDGADLHQLNKIVRDRGGALHLPALLFIVAEALSGLHYAHTRADAEGRPLQIVHRDVSPQNIMISREGEVKLIDFGIAKAEIADQQQTQQGIIKGKFYYMSPEQAYGHHIDARTDIFAAGMILHELIVGHSPYQGVDEARLLKAVRQADFTPIFASGADIAPDLAELITRATRRDPQQRFSSALEMQSALMRCLDQYGGAFRRMELAQYLASLIGDGQGQEAASAMSRVDYQADEASVIFGPGASLIEELEELESAEEENPFREEEPTRLWSADMGSKPPMHIRDGLGRQGNRGAGQMAYAGEERAPEMSAADAGYGAGFGDDSPTPSSGFNAGFNSGFEAQQFGAQDPGAAAASDSAGGGAAGYTPPAPKATMSMNTVPDKGTSRTAVSLYERLIPPKFREGPYILIAALLVMLLIVGALYMLIPAGSDSSSAADESAQAQAEPAAALPEEDDATLDLQVNSEPPGAQIYIDDMEAGVTPATVKKLGLNRTYEISLSLDGYQDVTREVELTRDIEPLELELKSTGGILKITTYPSDAKIEIDGETFGRSPVDVAGIAPGDTHKIVATLEDGRETSKDIVWEDKDERVMKVALDFEPEEEVKEKEEVKKPKPAPRRAARPAPKRQPAKPKPKPKPKPAKAESIDIFGDSEPAKPEPKKAAPKEEPKEDMLNIWGD